jgi:hypothetical protein
MAKSNAVVSEALVDYDKALTVAKVARVKALALDDAVYNKALVEARTVFYRALRAVRDKVLADALDEANYNKALTEARTVRDKAFTLVEAAYNKAKAEARVVRDKVCGFNEP